MKLRFDISIERVARRQRGKKECVYFLGLLERPESLRWLKLFLLMLYVVTYKSGSVKYN